MKVLLLKTIREIGQAGSICEVADAHARNYLLPKKLATIATPAIMAEHERTAAQRREQQAADADRLVTVREKLAAMTIEIFRAANPQGTLFAAVKSADMREAIATALGGRLPAVRMEPDTLKTVGRHTVQARWPDGATQSISIQVSAQ